MELMSVFGRQEHLVGWYCQPENRRCHKTAVVMLTPGMLHHVGPMRMHVELARRLADAGMASFRFDLSGIGESLAVASEGSSLQRASSEIGQAFDWLQANHGYERFILFGLCSGADDALAAAIDDPRIVKLSLMDGCGFRTRRFYGHWFLYKYVPKLLRLSKWRDLVMSRFSGADGGAASMPLGQDIREFGNAELCQSQVNQLLQRGVAMQWLYTGGAIDYYSYATQFFDMFPSIKPQPALDIHHLPSIDHLASLRSDRLSLLELIVNWCCAPQPSFQLSA
ncbi:MAG: alpha/beta hydrolase [Pirellulaceae bacterium]|nr:alpha/beta hydrolase [Pirellulaceae bacterium]